MKITVLAENTTQRKDLTPEMGFSAFIEVDGKNILFDCGQNDAFIQNAPKLGVDLSKTDFVALSHAHFDHTRGFMRFVEQGYQNYKLLVHRYFFTPKFWDQDVSYYYVGNAFGIEYINRHMIPTAMVSHDTHQMWEEGNVYLISGYKRSCLFEMIDPVQLQLIGGEYRTDDFREEMSLVIDTDKGLVVFNSCCHAGADTILMEAMQAFPGKKVHAIIGGFHLFESPVHAVREFGNRLQDTGVERVVTGHCTGLEAYDVLKAMLGENVQQMECGLELEF